jgi:serine protease AprX
MRRSSLRPGACVFVMTLLTTAALVFPSLASAKNSKVDPALDAAAASVPTETQLRVIVYGDAKRLKDAAEDGKLKIKKRLGLIGADSATVTAGALKGLLDDDAVDYVAPDLPVQPTGLGLPAFPLLSTLFPKIDGAPAVWDQGYKGSGVGVAVVDSGVAPVADFDARLTQVQLNGQTTVVDTYGHGSFVAGVLAGSSADGRYVGIAPSASVYAIDVNDASGVYTSNIILGLDWIDANRQAYNIRVVNVSLSENVATSYLSSPLDAAIERLWRDGVTVVVSAGNLGPGTMQYAPANDPFPIAVGAVDNAETLSTGDDSVAAFSSSGTTPDGFEKPDLVAPGRRIPSILPTSTTLGQQAPLANILAPGYATMSGTSFAAPQVAGAAALLLQAHPSWTPDQVKWALTKTARSVSGSSARALDVAAAIALSGTPGSANSGVTPAPQPGSSATSATATENTSSWNTSSWNTSSWNTSSWNTSSWNTSSWNTSSWNLAAWD